MRSVVDLPAPERPITPTNCPGGMARDTPDTATDLPNRFVKSCRTSTNVSRLVREAHYTAVCGTVVKLR